MRSLIELIANARAFAVGVVALALTFTSCVLSDDPVVTTPTPTPPPPIRAWTVNIEHLLPEHNWRVLLDRMSSINQVPDLLFVQEIDRSEVDKLASAVNRRFGSGELRYAFEHSDTGDNLIMFKRPRFELAGDAVYWRPWSGAACDAKRSPFPDEALALTLRDHASGDSLIAASLHFPRGSARPCLEKNLAAFDARLSRLAADPRMTIVAGDFNSHPDTRRAGRREPLDTGRQADPDCWYRSFSAAHGNELVNARPGDDLDCRNNEHYSVSTDSYYDAVYTAQTSKEGIDALCDQWTSIHGAPTRGSACTDNDGDGLRDRGRIDYIWVRWTGVPDQAAADVVVDASADLVCILKACSEVRYSDHRAVYAEIGWP